MFDYIKQERKKYPRFCEFIRFLLISGITVAIDVLVMVLIIYVSDRSLFYIDNFSFTKNNGLASVPLVIIASLVGAVLAAIFKYVFSLLYVYGEYPKRNKKQLFMFFMMLFFGICFQTIGLYIGYSVLKISQWGLKIMAVGMLVGFNYLIEKLLIFKTKKCEPSVDEINNSSSLKEKMTKRGLILNIWFVISSGALCLLMYNPRGNGWIWGHFNKYVCLICTVIIVAVFLFVFKKNLLLKIDLKRHKHRTLIVIIYTLGILYILIKNTPLSFIEAVIYAFLSSFAVFCYSYLIVFFMTRFIVNFWRSLNGFRKKTFIVLTIVGLVFNCLIFIFSPIFAADCLHLGFDTSYLLSVDFQVNQFNLHNDIRHIFMSLFIMPFAMIPYIVSLLFWFIPALEGLFLSLVQVIIMSYVIVTLLGLLKIDKKSLAVLFCILFLCLSGTFYNVLTTEKYVFILFYIITTIKTTLEKSSLRWVFFFCAVGILSTNIILLPFVLLANNLSFKERISEMFLVIFISLCFLIMFGQFNTCLLFTRGLNTINEFANIDILNNFIQYLIFVSSMIFSPKVSLGECIWQVSPSFNVTAIIGICVLILSIVGFILNYKDKYAQICFYWQIFMFILLVSFGWGAAYNEMFIYSALFTWSTISLLYMFINSTSKNIYVKRIVIAMLICAVITYNAIEFIQIFDFMMTLPPHDVVI